VFRNNSWKYLLLCFLLSTFTFAGEPETFNRLDTVQFFSKAKTDIDMFIGNWKKSSPRSLYGTLELHDILTKCDDDPLRPKKKGGVLTDILCLSFATLKEHTATTTSKLKDEQQIFYINSGHGIIKSGNKTAELREGIGVLMPPGIEFTITNTMNEPLTMYLITEPIPQGFKPNKWMVVKDEYANPISSNITRVNRTNEMLFSMNDGLSTLIAINPIMFEPKSFYPPHAHPEGDEEIWLAIKGDARILLGKDRRNLPAGTAYKVPADGKTSHTNINDTDVSVKLMWMMKTPVASSPRSMDNTL